MKGQNLERMIAFSALIIVVLALYLAIVIPILWDRYHPYPIRPACTCRAAQGGVMACVTGTDQATKTCSSPEHHSLRIT